MIDLYTWGTPNGKKISIALEEMELPYTVHPINIGANEQFAPEFLKISPNNKIPAIVDRDNGQSVFESGAILIYLALKADRFYPAANRTRILEWLMWQMSAVGRCWAARITFSNTIPARRPSRRNGFRPKRSASMACSTGCWRTSPSCAASIRLPTSRPSRGSRATSGSA